MRSTQRLPFAAGGSLAALAPKYPKTQCSFGTVIGRLNPLDLREYPERIQLYQETPSKPIRLILPVMGVGDEVTHLA